MHDRLCGNLHANWLACHLPGRLRFGLYCEFTKRVESGSLWLARRLPGRIRYAAFIVEVADVTTGPLPPGGVPEVRLGDLMRAVGEGRPLEKVGA